MDLWDVDIRRVAPFQANPRYLRDRTVEMVGVLYAMHWPFRQPETARGVRRSVLHDRLAARGACFGAVMGWERPNWYATPGMEPAYRYSFGRQNWFPCAAEEHRAVREAVGLFDQSSFAKFRLEGPDATAVLQRLCANDVDVPPGRDRLHRDAEPARRHRVRPHGDPPRRRRVPRRHRGRGRHPRCRLDPPAPRRRARRAHRRDVGPRRRQRHGPALAHAPRASHRRRPDERGRFPSAPRARSGSPRRRCGRPASPTWASWAGSCTSPRSSPRACTTRWWPPARTSACATPAITPWTRCAWRRRTARGATTSGARTRRSRPGSEFAVRWDKKVAFLGRDALLAQREQPLRRRLVDLHAGRSGAAPLPRRAHLARRRCWWGASPPAPTATPWAARWGWATWPIPTASATASWRAGAGRSRSPASAMRARAQLDAAVRPHVSPRAGLIALAGTAVGNSPGVTGETTIVELESLIDRLAALPPSDGPFVSLYVDARPDQVGREKYGAFVRTELKARARPIAALARAREPDADVERITGWLEREVRPQANGPRSSRARPRTCSRPCSRRAHRAERGRRRSGPAFYPLAAAADRYRRHARSSSTPTPPASSCSRSAR